MRAAYSIVELVIVMSLLSIFAFFALQGYHRSLEVASFQCVVQDLAAIDAAKLAWHARNPNGSFPADEPSRWSVICGFLPDVATSATSVLDVAGFYFYLGYTPDGYSYSVGYLTTPAAAMYHEVLIVRPN